MKTVAKAPQIFVFNAPSPELLTEMGTDYYRECQLAGAGSVETELLDHNSIGAVVTNGVLQVICTRGNGQPVVMRKFTHWARYSVLRGAA